MGTNYKPAVLPTRVGNALHTWHKGAKKRLKMGTLFSKKKNDGMEEQSLRAQNAEDSAAFAAVPLEVIMEDVSLRRYTNTTNYMLFICIFSTSSNNNNLLQFFKPFM